MTGTLPPQIVRKMTCYFYLASFCPPEYMDEFHQGSLDFIAALAASAGCRVDELASLAAPQAAKRILAFHLATRQPDPGSVSLLARMLEIADQGPRQAAVFQGVMDRLANLPARARPANRLHRNKGCSSCSAPCRFGFFTLLSEPDFTPLKALLDQENRKLPGERDAVETLWTFTQGHIWSILGKGKGLITSSHLGHLSYCLLLLATAKSRFALPEAQLQKYQELLRGRIRSLGDAPLVLT